MGKILARAVPTHAPGFLPRLALSAALLLPAAVAQQEADPAAPAPVPAAAEADVPSAKSDPLARPARRLLHLYQGGVLRGNARKSGEHWEYQRDGDWTALPAGAVASERLESAVLKEAGKRRAGIPRADAAALAAHVEWLVTEGLYKEALNLASDVLELAPDQPELLALLHAGAIPVGLPRNSGPDGLLAEDRAALLAYGGAVPRSLQELVIEELRLGVADGETLKALRAELAVQLTGRSAHGRAFAALALRRLVPAESVSQPEVEELLRRALRDLSPDVRGQASLALRDVRQEAVILPVLKALESPSPTLRTHAAESLGTLGYGAAVPALVQRLITLPLDGGSGGFRAPRANVFVGRQIAYVAGFSVDVAQNAAIGNPEIGTLQEGVTLDVAVLGASSSGGSYLAESKALRNALVSLTGANPGPTRQAWKSWWVKNGDRWTGTPATTAAGG